MWCMWLSDSGSGFGKIVKRQTDLQKKCQKGLHNDIKCSDAGSFATFYAISFDDFRLPKGNGEAGKYGNRA